MVIMTKHQCSTVLLRVVSCRCSTGMYGNNKTFIITIHCDIRGLLPSATIMRYINSLLTLTLTLTLLYYVIKHKMWVMIKVIPK